MSLGAPPDVIHWSPRSGDHGDCAVSAIELACGVTYERALEAALALVPDVLTRGMTIGEIRCTVEALGFEVRWRRSRYDLHDDTGILSVDNHVVYLWEGRIVEPKADRRQLWLDPEQFLHHYHYTVSGLLVVGKRKEEE